MANLSLVINSVAPITSFAYDYDKVNVSWQLPNPPTFKVFRLIRNQYSYSETQEDGEILFEYINGVTVTDLLTSFDDGVTSSLSSVPLVSGQYVYYTVWLLLPIYVGSTYTEDKWINAGQTHVLLPKDHGVYLNKTQKIKSSHLKMMDLLPRMYTSASGSPYDSVDETSDFSKFLKAFSFTYDEILTYADLSTKYVPAKKLATELTLSRLKDLGIRITSTNPSFYLKNLVSKAPYLLSIKGTKLGLTTFIETFTGFNANVSYSNNLLLRSQDSAFHLGEAGGWNKVGSYTTITIDTLTDTPSLTVPDEAESLKSPYRLKVTTTTGGPAIVKLGSSSTVTTVKEAIQNGIPVKPNTQYTFGFYALKDSAYSATTLAITPKIEWFNRYGVSIKTDTLTSRNPGTTWTKYSDTVTSPGKAITATGYTITSSSTTITLPTGHGFVSGDKIYIEDSLLPFFGLFTISANTSTSITIPYSEGLTFTGVTSSGTTFETTTQNVYAIKEGSTVTVTSGTGSLNGTTKVTSLKSETSFVVDSTPSIALNGATIAVSGYTISASFYVYKTTSNLKEELAEYAVIRFEQTSTASVFYLDNIWLGEGSTFAYQEAKCVYVNLIPSKINMLLDPSFIKTSLKWSSSGTLTNAETTDLTWIPYAAPSSSKMGKIVTAASPTPNPTTTSNPDLTTSSAIPFTSYNTKNDYYTFSIYMKGANEYDLKLALHDGVGNPTVKSVHVTTSWQRFSVTRYVTSSATGLTPYIYGSTGSQTFWVDNAQLEQSQKPTDYFDGKFLNQGAYWSDVSDESPSYMFTNKNQKITELALHMSDWIPVGMLWVIKTPVLGIEAISIPTNTPIASYQSGGGGTARTNYLVV